MPCGPVPACGEEAVPHASLDAEPQGLPPTLRAHWAAGTPHSGLKQDRVLPTAIAHLWEALAVNAHSATSVTTSPALGAAQTGTLQLQPCPAGSLAGPRRQCGSR